MLLVAALGLATAAKHIDWYVGHDWNWQAAGSSKARQASLDFALRTGRLLVDGIFPSFVHLNCSSGLLPSGLNFSAYAPFARAGIAVAPTLEGDPSCCTLGGSCPLFANRRVLAQQLLALAQQYQLSGYTQDWEFTSSWNHTGYNDTMAHVASVLAPHKLGLGNSISSACEANFGLNGAPFCAPAYRNEPWASVLTDMGTYSPVTGCGCKGKGCPSYNPQFNSNCSASEYGGSLAWERNGTRGSCRSDAGNDPAVIRYCGFEGQVMNMLHGRVATAYADRWPQLSPGLWLGNCAANGTSAHGWTAGSLRSFLRFLDSVGVTRVAVWCMAQMPCPTVEENCPWMYDALQEWKERGGSMRGRPRKTDDLMHATAEAAPPPRRWPSDPPHWPHYPSRRLQVLNGTWDFAFRPNGTFNAAEPGLRSVLSVNFSANAEVPGCFDSPTGLRPWVRGTGLYRTRVAVAPHHLLLLHLGAVSLWSAVLVDGELISTWDAGGFTPYWVGPFTTNNSVIEIIIVADNRFDEANRTVTQHANYGFYQFGGILRAVTVHELPSSLQLGISNSSSSGAHGSGTAYWYLKRVEVRVADLASSLLNVSAFIAREPRAVGSAQHGHVLLGLSFGSGGVVANRTVELLPSGEATLQVAVPQPQHSLWSPSSAALQTLTVWLYSGQSEVAVADAICVRFGLRTVAVHDDGRSIALNGAPVKLVGFNRHEMHPVYGSGGIPIEVLREDMQIIKRSHANYIRGSHYLQDQRWLDLCDENGIMVWEEVTAWGNSVADFSNPHFMAAEMITLHSMVDHSANHPCVVIFAFFNEGQSHHPGSTPAYAAMASALRSRDSTRLITWASNRVNASIGWSRGLPDVNLHLGDLVSFNWYPGWYECHVPGCNASMGCSPPDPAGPSCLPPTPQHWWEDKAQWAATAWPRKPFVISETGAGGVSGWHNGTSTLDFALRCRWPGRDEPCWSEEFQREVVASDVRAVVVSSKQQLSQRHASIAGISVWLLFDAQDNRGNCTGAQCIAHIDTYRPHALNSKGACSEWRQPKQVYYAISKLFDECAIDDV